MIELFLIVVVYKNLANFLVNTIEIYQKKYQKCLNDCVVFKGSDCIIEMLDHVLSFKGESKKVKYKIVDVIYF